MNICSEAKAFAYDMYVAKYHSDTNFERDFALYQDLPAFKACENIHELHTRGDLADAEELFVEDDFSMKPEVHWIMRSVAQYYLTEAFKAMKIDLDDSNIAVNALGKGTPGRIIKMWCGNDPEDTAELGSGRWNKQPYISTFPNTDKNHSVITKQVDVVSCCSHHFLPFSTLDGGKATISYVPRKFVLGISKLQRFVNWAARRFWLQEDLTQYIGKMLMQVAETPDVYVKLEGLVHGCEKFRGAEAVDGHLTTEFKNGVFAAKNIKNIIE